MSRSWVLPAPLEMRGIRYQYREQQRREEGGYLSPVISVMYPVGIPPPKASSRESSRVLIVLHWLTISSPDFFRLPTCPPCSWPPP